MSKRFLNIQLSRENLLFIIGLVWTAGVIISLSWNWHQIGESFIRLAKSEAINSFKKDLVYRRWVTMHEGVYVRTTEKTPPNPYLAHIPDRDVTTADGKELTLVNPAYMTRQVHEIGRDQYGLQGYLVSLKPLRPGNAPDAWEKQALLAFENGAAEVSSKDIKNGKPFFRQIHPFIAEESCLKCHRDQGYKVGDVLGGIVISVPLESYMDAAHKQRMLLTFAHLSIGSLGIFGLLWGNARLRRSDRILWESEKRFRIMADGSPFPIWVQDVDGHTVFINSVYREFFGTTLEEVQKIGWQSLVHPEDESAYSTKFLSALREQRTFTAWARLRRNDGQWRWIESHAVPRFSDSGEFLGMVGSSSDITELKQTENSLRISLTEKEVLLKEVHHRVKNNLAIISALLDMQQQNIEDPELAAVLMDMDNRLKSIVLVHERLYQSKNLARIDFQDYLVTLLNELKNSYNTESGILCSAQAHGIKFGLDVAIPLGMIINELVTNAIKYAFSSGMAHHGQISPEIVVAINKVEGSYHLIISDNGVGFPLELDLLTSQSFGLRLVRMIGAHQLGGRFELDRGKGTRVTFIFEDRHKETQ
jgi:PAS domain S-box-containing protein